MTKNRDASALLESLTVRGVILQRRGDALAFDAPSGVLTEADRANIRRLKPDLLELLARPLDAAPAHRWREATPVCPVALLDELIEGGATLADGGEILRVRGGDFDERTKRAVREHQSALLALWRFRQYGLTRVRFLHFICPDERLLALWRAAQTACDCALTIAGNRARTAKKTHA